MTAGDGQAGYDTCGARTRSGGFCRRPAGWGTATPGIGKCKLHLGGTPNHRAHASGVLLARAEQQARTELDRLGVDAAPVTNPLELLAVLCGEARQWQEVCRAQLDEVGSITTITPAGFEQLRAEISLWERAIDRVERFATSMAKLNLDERIFKLNERLSEAQGRQAFAAYQAGLALLELTPRQWELARQGFPRVLRALAGTADD